MCNAGAANGITAALLDIASISGKTPSLQSSNSRGKSKPPAPKRTGTTKRKAKPGVLARKNVERAQKNSDCLVIPHTNFQKLVRECAAKYYQPSDSDDKGAFRISNKAFLLLQHALEDHIYKICKAAYAITLRAKGQTLTVNDINLVIQINNLRIAYVPPTP